MKALANLILAIIVLAALAVGVSNATVILSTRGQIVSQDEAAALQEESGETADAIVVLGASVKPDGTPSSILQDRIQDGVNLYFAGLAPKIIMSGDNSTDSYNEVACMKAYAVSLGVPADDVFCDHAGFSTYDSMWRARNVFGAQSVIVATQSYHLPRALFAAKGLGMKAVGVPSDYRSYQNQAWYDLREVFARVQDFAKTMMGSDAQTGGEAISLDQSGSVTD